MLRLCFVFVSFLDAGLVYEAGQIGRQVRQRIVVEHVVSDGQQARRWHLGWQLVKRVARLVGRQQLRRGHTWMVVVGRAGRRHVVRLELGIGMGSGGHRLLLVDVVAVDCRAVLLLLAH